MISTTHITQAALDQHSQCKPIIEVSVSELKLPAFLQRALVVTREREYELKYDFETVSFLAPHEVRIRSHAVGLNQIDYKSIDHNMCLPDFPWITGREMAGVVEEVGSAVHYVKPGQRVWTSTYYRDRRAGCFQDFVIVPEHTVCPISTKIPFTSAACLGVCALTAAMTLWRWFNIPASPSTYFIPSTQSTRDFILIWGGSSVTGQFLVQMARRNKLRVITVASTKIMQLLLEFGAEHVVVRDGKSIDKIVEEVRKLAGDDITMAIDLVGAQTAVATVNCLSKSRNSRFAPLAWAPKMDLPKNVEMLNVEMKQFVLDPSSRIYAEQLTQLVEDGQIKFPEIEILKGGLDVVPKGLEKLKRGDTAGKKLVVDMTYESR